MSEGNPVEEFFAEVEAREGNRNQLLSYWCELYPNLNYSPKELYALVAKNLEAQQVPALEANHVMMREGGAFSSARLYFQLRREKLVFEMCGAPFGTGFFVSSRLFDRRREANWFHVGLVVCATIFLVAGGALLVMVKFGWVWGAIAFTGALALIWSLLRLAATTTLAWLDRALSDLPIIGLVYERFFHPDTYYRQDTNNAYCKIVSNAVRQAIDEMMNQKGRKPMSDDEWRPVMRDLQRK